MSLITKITGDFGEHLVSFLISKKYESKDPVIIRAGAEGLPYDLLIPHALEGSPFMRPAAICVKTRGRWSDRTPPTREEIKKTIDRLRRDGFEYWIAFLHYEFEGDGLSFETHLMKAEDLGEGDFIEFKRRGETDMEIRTSAIKEKAKLSFYSKDLR